MTLRKPSEIEIEAGVIDDDQQVGGRLSQFLFKPSNGSEKSPEGEKDRDKSHHRILDQIFLQMCSGGRQMSPSPSDELGIREVCSQFSDEVRRMKVS